MSEPTPLTYETQKDRWIKYGGNVVLVSVVVVALAVLLIWLFDKPKLKSRTDTTMSGLYSLKPQTVNIIKNNKMPIRIISLYTKPKRNPDDPSDEPLPDHMGPVADLLQEYERKGSKIEVEIIDPVENPTKVDQLIADVTEKYGGEIDKYKKFIADFMPPKEGVTPTTRPIYTDFRELAEAEAKQIGQLLKSERLLVRDQDLAESLMLGIQTIGMLPRGLERVKDDAEKKLKQKPPDYKGVVDALQTGMEVTSSSLSAVIRDFERGAADPEFKGALKDYIVASVPRYKDLKKRADDTLARINALGELKLDQLRSDLRAQNAILVMGPDELRSLPYDRVWQPSLDPRSTTAGGKPKRKFAGEQQVTSAILAVSANKKKQKVAFVRGGGPPIASDGVMPGRVSFAYMAERLREYNFEVLEKDLSGMWAMQAQMRQMPAAPEPSDEDIKGAIWVVYAARAGGGMMGGPPPSIAPRLAAHLEAGGSALVIPSVRGEDLAEALGPWGVKLHVDAIAMHPLIDDGATSSDEIEEAFKQYQHVFITNNFGDHAIAKPIKGLDGVLLPITPVSTESKPDRTVTRILPITFPLGVWGETNLEGAREGPAVFNAPAGGKAGDIAAPIFGGAVSEKPGGGRLVVLGASESAMDHIVPMLDPTLRRKKIEALRFPANGELFMNSVFWLARQDTMIAISASALDTNRVRDVSPTSMNIWRGMLLGVLPLGVIVAGAMVYFARRD